MSQWFKAHLRNDSKSRESHSQELPSLNYHGVSHSAVVVLTYDGMVVLSHYLAELDSWQYYHHVNALLYKF